MFIIIYFQFLSQCRYLEWSQSSPGQTSGMTLRISAACLNGKTRHKTIIKKQTENIKQIYKWKRLVIYKMVSSRKCCSLAIKCDGDYNKCNLRTSKYHKLKNQLTPGPLIELLRTSLYNIFVLRFCGNW